MIDLHIHTKYSFDGSESVIDILKDAEKRNLDIISFTDHNNTDAYFELEKIKVSDYYSGKIITGIELNTKVAAIPIEILGYNIDYKKMNELAYKTILSAEKRTKIEFERLVDKCKKYGIKLDDNILDIFDYSEFTSGFIHRNMTKYPENKEKIDERSWNSSRDFYRDYMSNPNTPLFVAVDDLVPDLDTTINIVKESGGLVFIPHIYEYRNNTPKVLDELLKNKNIAGFECYYTTFSEEQHQFVLNLCKEKNYYMSGGSDFHGKTKPDVQIGVGVGNLKIPTELTTNWAKFVNIGI